jgi:hypothetical protein
MKYSTVNWALISYFILIVSGLAVPNLQLVWPAPAILTLQLSSSLSIWVIILFTAVAVGVAAFAFDSWKKPAATAPRAALRGIAVVTITLAFLAFVFWNIGVWLGNPIGT